jgi:hypothetical protein
MLPRMMNGPLVLAAVDVLADQVREWVMQRLLLPSLQTQAT